MKRIPEPPFDLADFWESYSGKTKWVEYLREFGRLGGLVVDFGGVPRSASAIPLTFALYKPDGTKLPCNYRLKDIKEAIETLKKDRTLTLFSS